MPEPTPTKKPEAPDGYVRLHQLAEMLGVHVRTIRRWEKLREGPPKTKIGRQIYYSLESLYKWMKSCEKRQPRRSRGKNA